MVSRFRCIADMERFSVHNDPQRLTPNGVRQESWQRTGGESPLRGKV
jgi:hypothetical protein